MTDGLRVLVVDDEPAARTYLRSLLEGDADIETVEEQGNGRDAVRVLLEDPPDLVLLDIQMPELGGLDVVREVGVERMPVVVFITAHDDHALDAFRVHAFDYVLKPVDRERFAEMMTRAKRQVRLGRSAEVGAQLRALLGAPAEARGEPERLAIKVEGRILLLDPAEIDWVEASDDYARLHVGKHVLEIRETLARLESRLPAARFMRIHRSAIVNIARIREVHPWFQNDFVVVLGDGTRITSGRSYRQRLQDYLRRAR